MKSSFIFSAFILASANSTAFGASPLWDGDATATQQHYLFTNNDDTGLSPDSASNPYGTAMVDVFHPNPFASHWQDPGVDSDYSGPPSTADGTWGIGPDGEISASVPFTNESIGTGETFVVEFYISTICYIDDLAAFPYLEIVDYSVIGLSESTTHVEDDDSLAGGDWNERVWTGRIEGVTTDILTFKLATPDSDGSSPRFDYFVDDLEIFTNFTVVPEPSSFFLLAGSGMILFLRRLR
ncbi:PEP-CTERM sorting domain-containing protein [Roseibacillus ishigakijimensis]|uniref:PEP-CTERM sorting domain-containing protein n=1 Tax=Roseibacillus ishigakijimensis TaxID=454146 RepID=A0A934RJG4_9BACT|nr:PEP-CTERM sorting domain-containing protein [Roseibacillus ishigakijimensis]MBK1832544.1 PEP-CTERM sorting domain-containing protein [Roseibacillus ishigakijimensis]